MPNYEFECDKCKTKITEYLAIKRRNDKKECPDCKYPMTRLIGKGSGFNLKGDGFYKKGWNV